MLGTARTSPAQRARWRFAQGLGDVRRPSAWGPKLSTRCVPSPLCERIRRSEDKLIVWESLNPVRTVSSVREYPFY